MKKLFKSILSLSVAFVLVLPLLLLAGCSKKYTITVSINAGEGSVLLKQVSTDAGSSKSVVGKNSVAEGEKFEFLITPNTGYQIKSIKEDGVLVEGDYDKAGTYRSFANVKANHKVEVEFEKVEYTVTFMCKNGSDEWETYTTVNVKYDEAINLNAAEFGGENNNNWYKTVNGNVVYLYNDNADPTASVPAYYTADSNTLVVKQNWTIYTNKTAAEIPAAE